MGWGDLLAEVRAGRRRSIARMLSAIERGDPEATALVRDEPVGPHARVIGITGPPGCGKSTLTSALISAWRDQDLRVAVLAVDPSAANGGALLGDRVRMREHELDERIFVRSMSTRGSLGGLAFAVPRAVKVLRAAGFDRVVVETVGVGQTETAIAALAHTVVVVDVPHRGDEIQAAKAGLMDVGDVFVVNKADLPGARRTAMGLRRTVAQARREAASRAASSRAWTPPVVQAVAEQGSVDELLEALDRHRQWQLGAGDDPARFERVRSTVVAMAVESVVASLTSGEEAPEVDRLTGSVVADQLDLTDAAESLATSIRAPATRRPTPHRPGPPE